MESNNPGQDKPIGIPTQDFSKDAPSTGAVKPKAMDAQGAVGKQFEGKFSRLILTSLPCRTNKRHQNHSRRSDWFNRSSRWRSSGCGRHDWKAVYQGRRHRWHHSEQHGWCQEGMMGWKRSASSVHWDRKRQMGFVTY